MLTAKQFSSAFFRLSHLEYMSHLHRQKALLPMHVDVHNVARLLLPDTLKSGPAATVGGCLLLPAAAQITKEAVHRLQNYMQRITSGDGHIFSVDAPRDLAKTLHVVDRMAVDANYKRGAHSATGVFQIDQVSNGFMYGI